MKIIILALSVFALGLSGVNTTVKADDAIDHYEGKEFKNKKEAYKTLKETSAEMAEVAASEKLDVAKMEQIHQTSYTTEDAVAYLAKKNKRDDMKPLAEKLEEVHISSERHLPEKLRRDFIAYQAELMEFIASK
jgi:hypothetical protein